MNAWAANAWQSLGAALDGATDALAAGNPDDERQALYALAEQVARVLGREFRPYNPEPPP